MKFNTLFALVATASAIKLGDDFNYDSTGGHASVKSVSSTTAPTLNTNVRGAGVTNTDTRGNASIEKKLVQKSDNFNYDSTGGHASVNSVSSTTAPTLNTNVRGAGVTNAGNDGTPVIEKKLIQQGDDFNYDSTGGHASVKSVSSTTAPTLNTNVRGAGVTNTDTRGNASIEKK